MSENIRMGSDRSFGVVFTVVFVVIALWPLMNGGPVRTWAISTAGVIALVSLLGPGALRPFNRIWFRFGLFLSRIASPVVMLLIFSLVITPTAFLMRAFGKDQLRQKPMPDADSYWIKRKEPVGTMKRQF